MPQCSVLLHRPAATMSGFLETKSLQGPRPPNLYRPQGMGGHLEREIGCSSQVQEDPQEVMDKKDPRNTPHHHHHNHLNSGYPGLHPRLAPPQLLGAALTDPRIAPCPLCLPLTVCPSHTWVEGLCCNESCLACLHQGLGPLLAGGLSLGATVFKLMV